MNITSDDPTSAPSKVVPEEDATKVADDPANVEGIAKFVAPMKNVEWVEIQPFHQLGAFKWKAMNLEYKHADTHTPTPGLLSRVIGQFRSAGCRVR